MNFLDTPKSVPELNDAQQFVQYLKNIPQSQKSRTNHLTSFVYVLGSLLQCPSSTFNSLKTKYKGPSKLNHRNFIVTSPDNAFQQFNIFHTMKQSIYTQQKYLDSFKKICVIYDLLRNGLYHRSLVANNYNYETGFSYNNGSNLFQFLADNFKFVIDFIFGFDEMDPGSSSNITATQSRELIVNQIPSKKLIRYCFSNEYDKYNVFASSPNPYLLFEFVVEIVSYSEASTLSPSQILQIAVNTLNFKDQQLMSCLGQIKNIPLKNNHISQFMNKIISLMDNKTLLFSNINFRAMQPLQVTINFGKDYGLVEECGNGNNTVFNSKLSYKVFRFVPVHSNAFRIILENKKKHYYLTEPATVIQRCSSTEIKTITQNGRKFLIVCSHNTLCDEIFTAIQNMSNKCKVYRTKIRKN